MDKKKAIICTILFFVVLISVIFGSFLVFENGLVFSYIVCVTITGWCICDWIVKFYNWLMK